MCVRHIADTRYRTIIRLAPDHSQTLVGRKA